MYQKQLYDFFPVIDLIATGENIVRLRKERGLSVRDLQCYFGFEEPQAIYKWQKGKSLPTVDNLYALSKLLGISMNDILVSTNQNTEITNNNEQSAKVGCSFPFNFCFSDCYGYGRKSLCSDHFSLHNVI